MIELRWLDAPLFVQDGPLPDGVTASIPRKQILQYRELNEPFGMWMPWKNVPTVKYEYSQFDTEGKDG